MCGESVGSLRAMAGSEFMLDRLAWDSVRCWPSETTGRVARRSCCSALLGLEELKRDMMDRRCFCVELIFS
jgi:hypothetical protein